MVTWPPERPGPSGPAKRVTMEGACGMRLSTGGRAPDFTCSARIGVSCRAGSGSAQANDGHQRPSATAVNKRLFMSNLASHSSLGLRAGQFYQFGPAGGITFDKIGEGFDRQRRARQSDIAQ